MVEHLSHEYGSAEAAVLHLMALANIDMDDLKDYKKKLRSFSNATYSKIAPLFNLSPTVVCQGFHPMTVPRVSLPLSVQRDLFLLGRKALNQYGHPSSHVNEQARVGFLDKVHVLRLLILPCWHLTIK
jgi:hypothetical protein